MARAFGFLATVSKLRPDLNTRPLTLLRPARARKPMLLFLSHNHSSTIAKPRLGNRLTTAGNVLLSLNHRIQFLMGMDGNLEGWHRDPSRTQHGLTALGHLWCEN